MDSHVNDKYFFYKHKAKTWQWKDNHLFFCFVFYKHIRKGQIYNKGMRKDAQKKVSHVNIKYE